MTDNTYRPGLAGGFNRMPLLYPPEELWCVMLKVEPFYAPAFSKYQLVFVARHQDLYNADWVIHVAIQPPASPEIEQTLSRLGCDIDVSKQQKNFVGGRWSIPGPKIRSIRLIIRCQRYLPLKRQQFQPG